MQVLEDMSKCYGCHACYNICPVNAISMQENEEGFLMPVINTAMCVQCGKCREVCPVLNTNYKNDITPKVMAVMALDEIRSSSSSGGGFTLLANYVLNNNGVVCGSSLNKNLDAEHIIIRTEEQLDLLRKSKYVQSRIGNAYNEVKKYLQNEQMVLFVGTPCQVEGLYSFLGSKFNTKNLITTDLLCHGVPSPRAWKIFLEQLNTDSPIVDAEFRTKKDRMWKPSHDIRLILADGKDIIIPQEECVYTKAFVGSLINRRSCGQCQFSRCPRQGDFTLGDFWGAKSYDKTLNDGKGTTALFINNDRAKKIFNELDSSTLVRTEEIPLEVVVRKNSTTYRFPRENPDRTSYIKTLMETKSFADAEINRKMEPYDVGIVSWFYATNYGAVLTGYALTKALADLGYSSMLVDIPKQFWKNSTYLRNPLTFSKRFIYKYCNVSSNVDLESEADMARLNRSCKSFAVASDQLWRWDKIKSIPEFFFLGFARDNKKRFSYSTSFGGGRFACDDEQQLAHVKEMLKKFAGVSVREKNGVKICKNTFGIDAECVLDPVFLCKKEDYDKLTNDSKVTGKKFITVYMLAYSKEKENTLKEIAKIMQRELILIPDAAKGHNSEWSIPVTTDLEIEDFLYYIKNSDLVITDSFHAVCFSLIFATPFIATSEGRAGKDRFTSILNTVGMEERLLPEFKQLLDKPELLFDHPDFSYAHKKLQAERIKSLSWLLSVLESK